ncbi:cyclopropane fatty-acyl-phospholipid synthase-like methyltransferase [Kordia periserrulae]|uniref:Cyclopropane fatty-acyl-phospholipid synthase-like methyltransferase n=1 Tax=Kordia periserrulae TaxID=701523 RepID=A0A2T6BXX7_9FLAO|nr:class I SAM-dependent methyltransferase [Kordia periserrulae]PTX60920.1 cyclopropane fatty-acyl-phospholipid synthase-like methyltransferase [Kordia periserrulae]
MKNLCLLTYLKKEFQKPTNKEQIINFYDKATDDYRFWSKDLNMHFGYFVPFKTNLLKRDRMLNQMNAEIFKRLQIKNQKKHIVDLGCGMGASIRHGIENHPKLAITGLTISSFQVEKGNELLNSERATILNRDYRNTFLKENTFDGAMAIESLCHSGCSTDALQETYRILKPNAMFVIADAFTKKDLEQMNPLAKYTYQGLCDSWSLESLGNIHRVIDDMKTIGFKDIKVQNIWYRVAPSVLHVPFAISGFILKKLFKKEPLKPESKKNLKGSFFALLSSLSLTNFGYYIITAKK